MIKNKYLRGLIYALGVIMIALGIALHSRHNFGNGPFTQFNTVLGKIFSIRMGTMMMIVGFLIMFIYFLKKRNKDIYLSVLATLLLGNVINFFDDVLLYNFVINESDMVLRILTFLLAINIISIGVVMMLKTNLSMLDMEMATILLNETRMLNKMNFGQVRMILDASLVVLSMILTLLFIGLFDISEYMATFAIFIMGGPLVNLYLNIYDRLFFKKSDVTFK